MVNTIKELQEENKQLTTDRDFWKIERESEFVERKRIESCYHKVRQELNDYDKEKEMDKVLRRRQVYEDLALANFKIAEAKTVEVNDLKEKVKELEPFKEQSEDLEKKITNLLLTYYKEEEEGEGESD